MITLPNQIAVRASSLDRLQRETWDIAVIGGGATGLGAAVDAASRGLRTVLLEGNDFAKATSSRSTKLIHGGVRYLKQGNLSLVRESLQERELLLSNASGIVQPLEFVIPTSSWRERMFYGIGLKAYDFLAGRSRMPRSRMLSTQEVRARLPTIREDHLRGGVSYFDAQFDDSRLALALAAAIGQLGGIALNYLSAVRLLKRGRQICGVVAEDQETHRQLEIQAKAVINATGIFSDSLQQMDAPGTKPMLQVSRGSHLVFDRSHLPGETAMIIPSTDDGRVVFVIPWHGAVVVGTTDMPAEKPILDPFPLEEEIDFLLDHACQYLNRSLTRSDIRSMFCGLRPLVKANDQKSTSQLSRDHVIRTSASGLVTIAGGKWTTYRKMGSDAVDAAIATAGLDCAASTTRTLVLEGKGLDLPGQRQDAASVTDEFITHAVRHEQARTVEDVLSRRCRLLFLDARAAIRVAPRVAEGISREFGYDAAWQAAQVSAFQAFAERHLGEPFRETSEPPAKNGRMAIPIHSPV